MLTKEKTVQCIFASQIGNRHVPLKMNNMQLADVEATKFLGLSLQSNLKWNVHITELNTKLSSLCYCIQNSFNSVSRSCSSLRLFCKCAFPPEIWHNIWEAHPVVFRPSDCKENYSNNEKIPSTWFLQASFHWAGILPLPCLFIYDSVIFVKNDLLNGGNIFSCNIDIYNYNTRRRNHVHQVSVSTAQYKKSTYNTCTLLYKHCQMT